MAAESRLHTLMFWFSFMTVFTLDQFSKYYIRNRFSVGQSLPVIGQWIQIVYKENPGAAFGIMPHARWLLICTSIVSIVLAIFLHHKLYLTSDAAVIAFGLVAGGAFGNVVDRICQTTVTDFIYVKYFPAVFNIADSAIVIGSLMIALMLFENFQIID